MKNYQNTFYLSSILICLFFAGNIFSQNSICYTVAEDDSYPNHLYAYEEATQTWNYIGLIDSTYRIEGIAIDDNTGILYAFDGGRFGSLNTNDATFNYIGDAGIAIAGNDTINITDVDGLTYDGDLNILYAAHRRSGTANNDVLVQIDPATGNVIAGAFAGDDFVRIEEAFDGTLAADVYDVDALALHPITNELFAVQSNNANGLITTIDKSNGNLISVIYDTSDDDIEGLGFNAQGILYATSGDNGNTGSQNNFMQIDYVNNTTTLLQMIDPTGVGVDFESFACYVSLFSNYSITTYPFYDLNNNGIFDSLDVILNNQYFESDSTLNYYLSADGTGSFYLDSIATYDVNYISDGNWTANPNIQTVVIDSLTGNYDLFFPLTPNSIFDSITVDLASSNTICDLNTNYWLTITNEGTNYSSGVYTFTFPDSLTTYFTSSENPDSIINNTLYFSYDSLAPTQNEQIIITLSMPDYTFMGDTISVSTNVDGLNSNANSTLESIIVCSYDPNDKMVYPTSNIDNFLKTVEDSILTYTIRFQNTGTFMATNVKVADSLSQYLNLNTLNFISSSHNATINVNDAKRTVEFNFANIMLPDSGSNFAASNGYVKFSINISKEMPTTRTIFNNASIYFDSNPAVITNYVSSVYRTASTTAITNFEAEQLSIYPNPNNGIFNIKTKFAFEKMEVLDISGKLILTENNNLDFINLSHLNNGTYFVKFVKNNNAITQKLVIHK